MDITSSESWLRRKVAGEHLKTVDMLLPHLTNLTEEEAVSCLVTYGLDLQLAAAVVQWRTAPKVQDATAKPLARAAGR